MRNFCLNDLSDFQNATLQKLEHALNSTSVELIDLALKGKNEFYLEGKIPSRNIKIWIYKDGAELSNGKDIDLRYEKYDFGSSSELIDRFVSKILSVVT